MTKKPGLSGSILDPPDWVAFRETAHDILDACLDHVQAAPLHPWRELPEAYEDRIKVEDNSIELRELARILTEDVLPYSTGNTHPRFFGWVHGTGLASAIISEMITAAMNSNCGGRDHGMIYMEREVINWCKRRFGFPDSASGLLTSGTSQATIIALTVARFAVLGPDVRKHGLDGTRLTAYSGCSTHGATAKALEILGVGSDNLRLIPDDGGKLDLEFLKANIESDRDRGFLPFAIIANCGTVDLGHFDDLGALAEISDHYDLWLHVDGAFGAWTRLAEPPWKSLSRHIERADSIACDFHKWMHVQYDCGLVLIKPSQLHHAAFSRRPSYLQKQTRGLGSGEPWPCDLGPELSRGCRALKVWVALQLHGAKNLGDTITTNCEQAAKMGAIIDQDISMELASPVVSNICVFTADSGLDPVHQSNLNVWIAEELQVNGDAVLSTVALGETTYLRAAITNHRTTFQDIESTLEAVRQARGRYLSF